MSKKVDVVCISDNVCPWCYIGKKHLDNALKRLENKYDFTVDWRPFFLVPRGRVPKQGVPLDDYLLATHGYKSRVDGPVPTAGKKVGIAINNKRFVVPTLDSHRLIRLAKEQGKLNNLMDTLFKAYFEDAAIISDANVLDQIGTNAGLVGVKEYIESDRNKKEILEQEIESRNTYGVNGVPYYVLTMRESGKSVQFSGCTQTIAWIQAINDLAES
eukprot:CAMPEP_0168521002 /NCGR_PEP_ID=MMETSP0405-20121227/8392_1 /TAXON_ID=498012 /ORGANISM="Trichosphaerium sp, Strain Am-I-7 wt" /LENGTH=214 /DNA_ID=CAMNT_0008542129 /DNA_START=27 /DNA_END=671 /DNA_ORIENTATION=-